MRSQLVSFGNFLLKEFNVKGSHVGFAEVAHAHVENWKHEQGAFDHVEFPSRFGLNDDVTVSFSELGVNVDSAKICGVHFYESKVKYDLDMKLKDDQTTRIYNVDSCFVYPG